MELGNLSNLPLGTRLAVALHRNCNIASLNGSGGTLGWIVGQGAARPSEVTSCAEHVLCLCSAHSPYPHDNKLVVNKVLVVYDCCFTEQKGK